MKTQTKEEKVQAAKDYMARPFTPKERRELEGLIPDPVITLLETRPSEGRKWLGDNMNSTGERIGRISWAVVGIMFIGFTTSIAAPMIFNRPLDLANYGNMVITVMIAFMQYVMESRYYQNRYFRFLAALNGYLFVMSQRRGDWLDILLDTNRDRQMDFVKEIDDAFKVFANKVNALPESEITRMLKEEMKSIYDTTAKPPATAEPEIRIFKTEIQEAELKA